VIKRAILCGVVALAAAATLTAGAVADRPTKTPLPFPDATGQFCEDFQVLVHATSNKEVLHVFSSGVSLITGVLKVELTNLTTGETLAINISGPGKISADGSTITGGGPWLVFGEAGQIPGSPDPGLLFSHGNITISFEGTGSITVLGTVEDLCAALAS
jgi:hypothetical protein